MKAKECVLKTLRTLGYVYYGRGSVIEEVKSRKIGQ